MESKAENQEIYRRVSALIGLMCDGVCPRVSIVKSHFKNDDRSLADWVSDYCKMPDQYLGENPTPDSIISCAEKMATSPESGVIVG